MTHPEIEKCLAMALLPDARLTREVADAVWADWGRTVYQNLHQEGAIETIFNRTALQPGATTKTMANAIRVYLLTGALP